MDYHMQDKIEPNVHLDKMNIAIIGNYVPRLCGIATFTFDVATWVARTLGPGSDVFVVAMNDREEGYNYPPMVRFEVLAKNPRDYPRASDYVNLPASTWSACSTSSAYSAGSAASTSRTSSETLKSRWSPPPTPYCRTRSRTGSRRWSRHALSPTRWW